MIQRDRRLDTLQDIELDLLLEGVHRYYGYDFRQYARSSLKRRIIRFLQEQNCHSVSTLQERVLHNPERMEDFLRAITVNVSAMFRDPGFFRVLREKLVPLLRTYPLVRIWCAGCSTGEEPYSLAILLKEEDLLHRCRIYATDIDESIVRRAKDGIFPLSVMKEYEQNYRRAGGAAAFHSYFITAYEHAMVIPELKQNIIFAPHNLATDASFNEFQVILCRNAMIYFNKDLQDRVHKLLFASLCMFGVLGLGNKESLRFSPHENDFRAFDPEEKIYQRIG